jgi:iron complex outermembrane receptor protein
MTFRIASLDARPGLGRGTPPSARAPRPEHARAGDRHRQGADAGERRRLGRRAARAAPLQATTIDAAQMRDGRRAPPLGPDALRPSVTTAYDTEGYIDYFTIRGFVVDNRFNFRRDGLPINAETSIPLENKARVDILKGPLRPAGRERARRAAWSTSSSSARSTRRCARRSSSGASAAACSARSTSASASATTTRSASPQRRRRAHRPDRAQREGQPQRARARRRLARERGDAVEAEIENSHRSQPSVPGFSLLGDAVPAVADPKLNLNNQPWSLPVVFDATTGSLRVTQKLAEGWRLVAHGLVQRLRTDDRIAFPFGCTDPNPPPDGTYYPDRFCPNGNFDLYDFRSENESRRSSTLDVTLHGAAATGALAHEFSLGVQRTIVKNRFQASRTTSPAPATSTARSSTPPRPTWSCADEPRRALERDRAARRDRLRHSGATAWLGARHTQLDRSATPTDGSQGTAFKQSFTTPVRRAEPGARARPARLRELGQGRRERRGAERAARRLWTRTLPRYLNAGQALPAAESRQVEVGVKGGAENAEWSAAAFDIRRPLFGDISPGGQCGDVQCTRGLVGNQRHQGVEGSLAWRGGAWGVRAGAQWLHARVEVPSDPTQDGKKPTNVPAVTARLQGDWQCRRSHRGGLRLLAAGTYESAREVLPDNSVQIPSVTKFDLGARYETKSSAGTTWTLRAGIDNVFDRRAWRESPYQFSHAYLFPLEPRTLRVSLQADL